MYSHRCLMAGDELRDTIGRSRLWRMNHSRIDHGRLNERGRDRGFGWCSHRRSNWRCATCSFGFNYRFERGPRLRIKDLQLFEPRHLGRELGERFARVGACLPGIGGPMANVTRIAEQRESAARTAARQVLMRRAAERLSEGTPDGTPDHSDNRQQQQRVKKILHRLRIQRPASRSPAAISGASRHICRLAGPERHVVFLPRRKVVRRTRAIAVE